MNRKGSEITDLSRYIDEINRLKKKNLSLREELKKERMLNMAIPVNSRKE